MGGREFQRRMERISFFKSGRKRVPKANGRRKVRIIERFSDKWRDKVTCMKGSERIGRRQRRMGDL